MSERLPVWPVYRNCLRAWRRDFWFLTMLAGMILLPLLIVQYALYGAAGVSLSSDDSWSLWIVSIPVFVYAVESHHFMSALMEKLEGAERHGHDAPTLRGLLADLPWVRLFVADMLFTFVLVLGLLALVVPALILGTWFVLVMPLINLERQPVLATFRRSRQLVRGNFWRVLAVWAPVWLATTAASEYLGELLGNLGHSHAVHILAHLVPEMLLLPISALPAVIMTFELVDRDRLRAPGVTRRPGRRSYDPDMTDDTAPVRVGFLGGGFIAHYHGKMLHTSGADVEIAMVHDPDPEKEAAFAAASGAAVAAGEDELLDEVDAVYVCTWTSEHPRLVERVVERGLPVFCEKPLAVDLDAAVGMVDAVRRSGVVNQVGLVLRDSPAFVYLRHAIARPESGRVMSIVFRDDQYIPIQGQYGSTWRADPARAGSGTLLEHSIHDLDILEWMLGPVTGVAGRSSEFHALAGIEDVVSATLQFESGAIGSLTSIWHDLLERPSLRRVEVFCEHAFFWLENDVFGPVHVTRSGQDDEALGGEELVAEVARLGLSARNPDAAFIDAVRRGEPATPDFAAALRAHLLADAIYRSAADAGRAVTVPSGAPEG